MCVGDWTTAQTLIDKLPKQSVIVKEPVAKALANLIHYVIDPVYIKISGKNPRSPLMYENKLTVPQVRAAKFSWSHFFPLFSKTKTISFL